MVSWNKVMQLFWTHDIQNWEDIKEQYPSITRGLLSLWQKTFFRTLPRRSMKLQETSKKTEELLATMSPWVSQKLFSFYPRILKFARNINFFHYSFEFTGRWEMNEDSGQGYIKLTYFLGSSLQRGLGHSWSLIVDKKFPHLHCMSRKHFHLSDGWNFFWAAASYTHGMLPANELPILEAPHSFSVPSYTSYTQYKTGHFTTSLIWIIFHQLHCEASLLLFSSEQKHSL